MVRRRKEGMIDMALYIRGNRENSPKIQAFRLPSSCFFIIAAQSLGIGGAGGDYRYANVALAKHSVLLIASTILEGA